MRRVIGRNISLLIIMLIGSTVGQSQPKFVNYCSLFERTYEDKTVSSKALMFYSTVSRVDGADTFLYSAACNGSDYFAIPEGNSKVWAKWQAFFDKLPSEENLTLEIAFEGKLEVANAYLFGSLDGWARAELQLQRILAIRDVSAGGIRPNNSAAKPEIERVEGMRNDRDLFVQSLHSPSNANSSLQDILPDDFLFIDSGGKTFNKNQHLTLDAPWLRSYGVFKELRSSSSLNAETHNTLTWRSKLQVVFNEGKAKEIYCDITFVLRNGKWVLSSAAMVKSKTKH